VSPQKKEVIVGAIIVIITSLWIINLGMSTTGIEVPPFVSFSAQVNNLISWLATLGTVLGVAAGLLLISQSDKPAMKKWIDRYTLKATIPGYFLYALIPLIMGLLLILVLRQTAWGVSLACLSVPSTLVLLIFGFRKNREP